jgi:hypothetical protein
MKQRAKSKEHRAKSEEGKREGVRVRGGERGMEGWRKQ